MCRLCFGATLAIGHSFAPATCSSHDLGTPCPELGCGVQVISLLEPLLEGDWTRWRLDGAGIGSTYKRGKGTKFGHAQCPSIVLTVAGASFGLFLLPSGRPRLR